MSVDTKKKELIGRFRNPGAKWDRTSEPVLDHNFPSEADGRAMPYGFLDLQANPDFAVDCLVLWWCQVGHHPYPHVLPPFSPIPAAATAAVPGPGNTPSSTACAIRTT